MTGTVCPSGLHAQQAGQCTRGTQGHHMTATPQPAEHQATTRPASHKAGAGPSPWHSFMAFTIPRMLLEMRLFHQASKQASREPRRQASAHAVRQTGACCFRHKNRHWIGSQIAPHVPQGSWRVPEATIANESRSSYLANYAPYLPSLHQLHAPIQTDCDDQRHT